MTRDCSDMVRGEDHLATEVRWFCECGHTLDRCGKVIKIFCPECRKKWMSWEPIEMVA